MRAVATRPGQVEEAFSMTLKVEVGPWKCELFGIRRTTGRREPVSPFPFVPGEESCISFSLAHQPILPFYPRSGLAIRFQHFTFSHTYLWEALFSFIA